MKKNIKSKVIVPHSPGCKSEWSGILDANNQSFPGNYYANPNAKVGRFHFWYRVLCNNSDCKGIKAVHSSVLADA
jgi:hypothetical protein